jgi:CheY-like chemotaxis protein
MMESEMAESDPDRAPVHEILVAAQRAASLTRQLLAFSRRQMLQPIRLNLNTNVSSTQRMLSRLLGENITIVTEWDERLRDVFADPGQIDQIILNLAVNARDAMERGGTLTISTGNAEVRNGMPGEVPDGRYAILRIADTGHGMDAETRKRIFEPFFTTKEVGRGTGLGLSTVYGIVKQSGGHILVESEPGKGTAFSIYLPALDDKPQSRESDTVLPEPVKAPNQTILVMEDDEVVRQLVCTMLRASGYRVIAPATPADALRHCNDPETCIDLLLTDMVLPSTDGAMIAEAALRMRPELKVLYMSGYTEHGALRRSSMDNGRPFLQKPFTANTLVAKVREAMR